MPPLTDWRGRVAVLTGATGGIGRPLAFALAERGAELVLAGRSAARLSALGDEIRAVHAGATFDIVELDLAGDLERDAASLMRWSSVDLLVHGAGAMVMQPIEEVRADVLDQHYRINVRAPFVLTRTLLPALKRAGGQVVFVNSSAAEQKARADMAAYAASKYALTAVADSLRAAVNADGVRVLSIYPGRTATPMQAYMHGVEGKPYRAERLLQPDDVCEAVLAALALPRTAEITDISIRPLRKG